MSLRLPLRTPGIPSMRTSGRALLPAVAARASGIAADYGRWNIAGETYSRPETQADSARYRVSPPDGVFFRPAAAMNEKARLCMDAEGWRKALAHR